MLIYVCIYIYIYINILYIYTFPALNKKFSSSYIVNKRSALTDVSSDQLLPG